MSRIIVKQLPKNITEEKIRSTFGSKGTITDVQLKYTPDGKFRQFCFIGYRSEDDAKEAIKHFDNTCIQTSRLKVELCSNLGSADKPQSWSKYSKDNKKEMDALKKKQQPEAKTKEKKTNKFDEIIDKHKNDPEFQEFMKVHDKNRTIWANDAVDGQEIEEVDAKNSNAKDKKKKAEEEEAKDSGVADNDAEDEEEAEQDGDHEDESTKVAEKPISDLEYMKSLIANKTDSKKKSTKDAKSNLDLFTIKIHDVPYKTKRQEVLKFFKPLKPYSVRLPSKVHGFCYVGFKTEKEMTKAMLKNKSFIKGKQVFFSDFTEKNKITKAKQLNGLPTDVKDSKGDHKNSKWRQQEESLANEEGIAESGRIFFRNLSYTVTDDDLQKLFEPFGPVAELHLPVDSVTRQIKGFGTVTYVMPEHAVLAFNQLDGNTFHGRLLHLIPGKGKASDDNLDENDSTLTFKQKKALKLKKTAQQSVSWNTLFLGPNAVAEILARQYDTTKQKILDTEEGGSGAAVRLALGETQIVLEMKKFLEDSGIRLNAFDSQSLKRSKTIMLAKNLPADTTVADLSPIFSKFGPIGRLILPPSGVTAVIEYCDPTEAKQAFKKLAYSKFKNVPLYLEWAPEDTFTKSLSGEPMISKLDEIKPEIVEEKDNAAENADELNKEDENADDDSDEQPEPNTTLFLRNLNFKTVQETVHQHFKHIGPIHTVEIAKRKDPNNPRVMTSLGYGFIQFKKNSSLEKALKNMQLTNIDGNQVELKRSDRTLKTVQSHEHARKKVELTKQTGTKILVRNIPFQAKVKEVRAIFQAFGELRSVRLPKKMTPGEDSHRGFGFVEFLSKSEAKKAFDALSQSTHLYGRRIVLEWASKDEEDVAELQKRTALQFLGTQQSSSAKRSKRAIFEVDVTAAKTNYDADDMD